MNGVGQSGERKSYRVILLLVVGLTAFSSAMKELNLLREFSRDTSDMVASWSRAVAPQAPQEVVVPAEIPPVPETVEICESSHAESAEPVELDGGIAPAEVQIKEVGVKNKEVGKTFVAERSTRRGAQAVATLRSDRSADIELMELRKQVRRAADLKVMILADSDGEADFAVPANFEFKVPKVKTWDRQIIVKPEHRELLKTLNRTFSLRSAG